MSPVKLVLSVVLTATTPAGWHAPIAAADEGGASSSTKYTQFRISRKMAVERGERILTEFGAPDGPYSDVAEIILSHRGIENIRVYDGGVDIGGHLSTLDPSQRLRLVIYANEGGDGFVVSHWIPSPEAPAEAEDAGAPPASELDKEIEDDRPWAHRELAESAEYAISVGKLRLLEALLQNGLAANEPLDIDFGWHPLHFAALRNNPEAARLLLAYGADRDARSRFGVRAIDIALDDGQTDFAEAIAKPNEKEATVSDIPEALLIEIIEQTFPNSIRDRIYFVALNGQDPSESVMNWFRKRFPDARPVSRSEELADRPEDAPTFYRDTKTMEYGYLIDLALHDEGEFWSWSLRRASGPFLAAVGSRGKIAKRHGYWYIFAGSSWDE